MQARISSSVGICAFVMAACVGTVTDDGGSPEQGWAALDQEGHEASVSEIARIELPDTRVSFLHATSPDGGEGVLLEEEASAFAVETPLDRLNAAAPLTSLETYLALAPDDAQAPELLWARHETEAKALGREVPSRVLEVEFDRDAPVQKSLSGCVSHVFKEEGGYKVTNRSARIFLQNYQTSLPLGGSQNYGTRNQAVLGACNDARKESMYAMISYWFMDPTRDPAIGWYWVNPTTLIPAGRMMRWRGQMTKSYNCGGSLLCTSRTGYMISGSPLELNGYFHLLIGEWTPNVR